MRSKAWVHPDFSPSRTFLLLTLSITLPHKPVPNPHSLHIHCFALALRHKARNRGDAETKKEDPFTPLFAHTHTDAHAPIPKFCSVLPPVTCVNVGSAWWFILLMYFFKGLIWLQLSFSLICFTISCKCSKSGTKTDQIWHCCQSSKAKRLCDSTRFVYA